MSCDLLDYKIFGEFLGKVMISGMNVSNITFETLKPSDPFMCSIIEMESTFISGVYWTLNALSLSLGKYQLLSKWGYLFPDILNIVSSCRRDNNSFASHPDNTFCPVSHILPTLNAIQICKLISVDVDKLIPIDSLTNWIIKCVGNDGAVHGNPDLVHTSDIRFTFALLSICRLCHIKLPDDTVNLIANWVLECQVESGGIGVRPGGYECHNGFSFCWAASVAIIVSSDFTLWKITDDVKSKSISRSNILKLYLLNSQSICRFQRDNGGFIGRSGKDTDSCYAFWVGATLDILLKYILVSEDKEEKKKKWTDFICIDKLKRFLCACGKDGTGKKNPHSMPDPFHTMMIAFVCIMIENNLQPHYDTLSVLPHWAI